MLDDKTYRVMRAQLSASIDRGFKCRPPMRRDEGYRSVLRDLIYAMRVANLYHHNSRRMPR